MDSAFEQEITLDDDRRRYVRFIRPADEALLRDGFARLSPASRYARFHTVLKELSGELVHRLTDVDGIDHCPVAFRVENEWYEARLVWQTVHEDLQRNARVRAVMAFLAEMLGPDGGTRSA